MTNQWSKDWTTMTFNRLSWELLHIDNMDTKGGRVYDHFSFYKTDWLWMTNKYLLNRLIELLVLSKMLVVTHSLVHKLFTIMVRKWNKRILSKLFPSAIHLLLNVRVCGCDVECIQNWRNASSWWPSMTDIHSSNVQTQAFSREDIFMINPGIQ